MKWLKRGKIFDPTRYALPNGCIQFAQSPHALVFNDFVRIYFSTRAVDTYGKFLSHIAFVDMKKNLRDIIRVSDQTVIPLGKLGCFDEHGIFPISVVRHGNLIYGYTCGWNRRVSVSVDTSIGLTVSRDDGLTFQRIGDGPVLAASLHEPCLVGDGFVRIIDGVFHMWYIFGTAWKKYSPDSAPDRTYKIGHATSSDGINWIKEEARQIVPDRLGPSESQALPTVIKIGIRYHMFFCYRESFDFRKSKERGYRIGHAWSNDLSNWTRDDNSPRLEGTHDDWDSDMQCYPHAFECDDKVYLLYNGNEFGRHGFGLAELQEMDTPPPEFHTNRAGIADLAIHLKYCDASFVPPLSARVDIRTYARKIYDKAIRFEAWHREELIGLVAAYCNDPDEHTAFITNVSVIPAWQGRGLATNLVGNCLDHLSRKGLALVELEINQHNLAAAALYQKYGFTTTRTDGTSSIMTLTIKK